METERTSRTVYRHDIDGLRALAVSLVLVFHFGVIPQIKAGFVGVDIFFVISGYLITTIIRRQMLEGAFDLRAFYIGRIRRLAPALMVVLLGVFVTSSLLLFPLDLMELGNQLLAAQFYYANIYFWRNVNYFGLGHDSVYLLHTWSLAVEEQFYLICPLVLVAIMKYRPRYLWPILSLALAFSFLLNLSFVDGKPEATFYLLPTRAWELLVGAVISGVAESSPPSRWLGEFLGILGVVLIAYSVVSFEPGTRFPGYFALWPVAGAAVLLYSASTRKTQMARCLSMSPFRYIGQISYPLYLVHWPVHVFAVRLLRHEYNTAWRWALLFVSVALAATVHHTIENPVRHRRQLRMGRALVMAYGAGLAASVLIFMAVRYTEGFPQRFPPEVIRLSAFANDKTPTLKCEFTGRSALGKESFCAIGRSGTSPTWVVYGDSHAWAAYAVFDRWLSIKGESGLFIFRHACPPIADLYLQGYDGGCFTFNRHVLNFLEANGDLGKVVLVSAWRPSSRESAKFYEKLGDTLIELGRQRKQVYIWEPVPGALDNVPESLARAAISRQPTGLEFTRAEYLAQTAPFYEALARNRSLVSGVFSPADALCVTGRCSVEIGGNPVYFDNSHITASNVDFWVEVLRRGEISQISP